MGTEESATRHQRASRVAATHPGEYAVCLSDAEVMRAISAAVLMIDGCGRVSGASTFAQELFGISPEEAPDIRFETLFPTEPEFWTFWEKCLPALREEGHYQADRLMRRKDGSCFWCRMLGRATKVDDADISSVWVLLDATAEKRLSQKLDVRALEFERATRQLELSVTEARRRTLEAEAAAATKTQFLAMVSHELRTPLHAIIGMSNLLLDKTLPQELREFVEIIDGAGRALLEVVGNMLDFTKMEAGKLALESIDFDLFQCIEDVTDLFCHRAAEKGVEIVIELDHRLPRWVRGDSGRLRQVLMNLIGNAVKFTFSGEVVLSARYGGQEEGKIAVDFELSDTGIGIAAPDVDRLFEPFAQADPSITRRFGGTGLGLAIVRALVGAMQGSIRVRSEPGAGSTFSFEILFDPPDHAPGEHAPVPLQNTLSLVVQDHAASRKALSELLRAAGAEVETFVDIKDALQGLQPVAQARAVVCFLGGPADQHDAAVFTSELGDRGLMPVTLVYVTPFLQTHAAVPEVPVGFCDSLPRPIRRVHFVELLKRLDEGGRPPSPLAPASPVPVEAASSTPVAGTILVVEDNRVNQQVTSHMLGRLGFACELVCDAHEALDALQRRSYALALLDCHLPGVDGFTLARQIRAMETPAARMPLVALTASVLPENQRDAMEAGMDAYLVKPVTLSQLQATLQSFVAFNQATLDASPKEPERPAHHHNDKLLRVFEEDCHMLFDRLARALDSGDGPAAVQAAHALKGAAANMGAATLRQAAADIEAAARKQRPCAEGAVTSLRDELKRFLQACKESGSPATPG